MGTIEGLRDAEGLFCATYLMDEWFEELSHVAAIKTDPQYNFHPWVGTDDQKVERRVLGDATVKEIHKRLNMDTIKELVRSFCRSISVMKLAG